MTSDQGSRRIEIRKALETDSAFAYGVKKAAFKGYIEKVFGWDEAEQRRMHDQQFAEQEFRIIRADGEDIGVITVSIEESCLRLNQMLLPPKAQRQGIGRECMFRLIDEANGLELPIRLRVLNVNPRAQQFYERLGFLRVNEDDLHVYMERPCNP